MPNDKTVAAADDLSEQFDLIGVGRDRSSRVKEWLITLVCWDGLLPIAVLSIPNGIAFLFPKWQFGIAMLAVFVPIAALSARFVHGWKRMRWGHAYSWQMILFTTGISALFLFEALLLNDQIGQGPKIADPTALLVMLCVYLAMMAIALFPIRREDLSEDTLNSADLQ